MAIPKQIFQTFKTKKLPLLTRFHIWNMKRKNPEYHYFFYDDSDIERFLSEEFPPEYINCYQRLTIGAAKADFFRYAILYKKGGVYLDVDSAITKPLRELIYEEDEAVISVERYENLYVQWALIFSQNHPFLKKTLELILYNIENHCYPNDVHATTGPAVFTRGIRQSLQENPDIPYTLFNGIEFRGYLQFKYKLGKFFLYKSKSQHWKRLQTTQDIIV
ncbi:glycosyl transferase [Chryseobacterium indologenes]|uniref:Glycosyl transferase n=1 Tax=Chryseobacterium indologenes TaxID=253 RepID=A0AAD1DU16_CHRID|nr:glycosyltransferase [Chryseobacterium indologenes]ATN05669.1 glycosyl transferase [Chryseobacterium indologenes]AYY85574.1 glycosyl transferase [Chryseobacterium indologenes]AZB17320.1 glycosyl transferase [Chryseobacterium indologenes]QIX82474.1 glycosyl transferase [Chryseobacterium indologenes]TLX26429.1 glycosyl transferase [Chryseobacterium indologenes]